MDFVVYLTMTGGVSTSEMKKKCLPIGFIYCYGFAFFFKVCFKKSRKYQEKNQVSHQLVTQKAQTERISAISHQETCGSQIWCRDPLAKPVRVSYNLCRSLKLCKQMDFYGRRMS